MSHSSCILSFDLNGKHQNKRSYVTEKSFCRSCSQTVISRRERNDDRKYVCGSQASFIEETIFMSLIRFVLLTDLSNFHAK